MSSLVCHLLAGCIAMPVIQQTPNPVTGSNRIIWSFATGAPSYGSGAAGDIDGDGRPEIVFGTYYNDEHVYALNGEDGSLLWKYKS